MLQAAEGIPQEVEQVEEAIAMGTGESLERDALMASQRSVQ
jgi:hypothetical protein